MNRLHMLTGTVAILVGMIAISTLHGTGFDLIMSDAPIHNILRSIIIVSLVTLALTTRPRPRTMRIALGAVASLIIIVALTQTFDYSLQLLDGLVYVASATTLMQEALETEPATEPLDRRMAGRGSLNAA